LRTPRAFLFYAGDRMNVTARGRSFVAR
jgi:hypothetical protein